MHNNGHTVFELVWIEKETELVATDEFGHAYSISRFANSIDLCVSNQNGNWIRGVQVFDTIDEAKDEANRVLNLLRAGRGPEGEKLT